MVDFLRKRWFAWLPAVLALLLAALLPTVQVEAEAPDAATADVPAGDHTSGVHGEMGQDWVRVLLDDNDRVLAMQTAIVRYAKVPAGQQLDPEQIAGGTYVDLVGAIHVGDKAYYEKLNERFEGYDALLYELVAPDGTIVPKGGGSPSGNPVALIQNGMKDMLELEHQLEQIDYTKANFVHADMSPDDLLESMRSRNESLVQMYFRLLGQSIAEQSRMAAQGQHLDVQLLAALIAPDRARQLKIILGQQLAETETLFSEFGGEQGSSLITERNKVALEELRRQLDAGQRHLAVFYGAGHLVDMDKRLRNDFGLVPVEITWLTAWDVSE